MLTISATGSQGRPFCDGLSRRNFIRIGSLAMGGLALPQILQAEAASGIRKCLCPLLEAPLSRESRASGAKSAATSRATPR